MPAGMRMFKSILRTLLKNSSGVRDQDSGIRIQGSVRVGNVRGCEYSNEAFGY